MRLLVVVAGSALALAACGSASSDGAAGTLPPVAPTSSEPTEPTEPTTTTEPDDDWPTNPPPVVFEPDGGPIEREPFTVCWSEPRPADPDQEYEAYCADGTPDDVRRNPAAQAARPE